MVYGRGRTLDPSRPGARCLSNTTSTEYASLYKHLAGFNLFGTANNRGATQVGLFQSTLLYAYLFIFILHIML